MEAPIHAIFSLPEGANTLIFSCILSEKNFDISKATLLSKPEIKLAPPDKIILDRSSSQFSRSHVFITFATASPMVI